MFRSLAGLLLAFITSAMVAQPVGALSNRSTTESTIAPQIKLSVTEGPPGTSVLMTGTGFPPSEVAAVYIDAPEPYLGQPGPRVNAQGAFTFKFIMPGPNYDLSGRIRPAAPGPHQICADTAFPGSNQPVAAKACTQFVVEVQPSPSPSPRATPPAPENVNAGLLAISAAAFLLLLALAAGIIYAVRRSS